MSGGKETDIAREAEALEQMLNAPLECFTHEREVDSFEMGNDSLPDQAESFLSASRQFAPRRVMRVPARVPCRKDMEEQQTSERHG